MTNKCSRSCFLSGFINEYDRYMDHTAGYKSVFTGLFSFHDNHAEYALYTIISPHCTCIFIVCIQGSQVEIDGVQDGDLWTKLHSIMRPTVSN